MVLSAAACGGDGTGPSGPSQSTYGGQWNGTTTQGTPIVVVVSSDQRVTSIAVGYRFNGCDGSRTFSNLTLPIGPPGNPGFGFGSGAPDQPDFTQVYGAFTSSETATGSVAFGAYPGCGNGGAIWNATKR